MIFKNFSRWQYTKILIRLFFYDLSKSENKKFITNKDSIFYSSVNWNTFEKNIFYLLWNFEIFFFFLPKPWFSPKTVGYNTRFLSQNRMFLFSHQNLLMLKLWFLKTFQVAIGAVYKQCLLVYYGFQVLIWMGMSRLLNPNCGSHLVIFVFNVSIEA